MIPGYLADIPSPPRGVVELGPLPLRAYAFCIIAGIVVATVWGNRRFVARGGRPGRVTDIAVFAVPFGLVGGRLYHVITDNELYFRGRRVLPDGTVVPATNPWKAFAIWDGGLGIWGAIALGAVGAWIGCRYYRVPLSAFADAVVPGVIVAQAIGRLGNYFNQELFGKPTTLPWGLEVFLRTPGGAAGTQADCGPIDTAPEFPTSYIKADPTVLCGTFHPTFLYELLWNLAVAALLVWADRRFKLGRGQVFWLYVAGYTLGRGWIEMLRIDTANKFFGIRINVFTSVVLLVVSVAILVARRHVGREDPATLLGKPSGNDPDRDELDGPDETDGPDTRDLDGAGTEPDGSESDRAAGRNNRAVASAARAPEGPDPAPDPPAAASASGAEAVRGGTLADHRPDA